MLSQPDLSWTGTRGHVAPELLALRLPQWRAALPLPLTVYLCGPEGFMGAAEAFLVSQGIDRTDIRRESFDRVLHDDPEEPDLVVRAANAPVSPDEGACETLVAHAGRVDSAVVPLPGESLLAALLRCGADVPHSCQEGTCASCIARVTEGEVRLRPLAQKTLQPSDLTDGLILACQARAASRTVRIDFDEL